MTPANICRITITRRSWKRIFHPFVILRIFVIVKNFDELKHKHNVVFKLVKDYVFDKFKEMFVLLYQQLYQNKTNLYRARVKTQIIFHEIKNHA